MTEENKQNKSKKYYWIIMFAIAITSVLVLILRAYFPLGNNVIAEFLHKIKPISWSLLLPIWFICIFVSNTAIFFIMRLMTYLLVRPTPNKEEDGFAQRADFYGPALVGTCEVMLYPIALIKDMPEFIGIWLVLKVAGQWKRWTPDIKDNADLVKADDGRRLYNKFLIGNALSIIFGILTYAAIKAFVFNN
jgi:hypothetical protein